MALDFAVAFGRGMPMWGHGRAFWWIALFLFLGFLALLAIGAVLLWRQGSSGAKSRQDEALSAVRMRYARGEMTREEFLQAHQDLGGGAPPAPPQAPPPSG